MSLIENKNAEKGLRQSKEACISWKQNLCIKFVREKNINNFEITVVIFKAYNI